MEIAICVYALIAVGVFIGIIFNNEPVNKDVVFIIVSLISCCIWPTYITALCVQALIKIGA